MSKDKLINYLTQLQVDTFPFAPEELNEPLITVYNIFSWALRDECNIIEVLSQQVIWRRESNQETVGEFPTPVDFGPFFQQVIDRDQTVREYSRLVEKTNIGVKYRIKV
jgi:hypothetical protein